MNKIRNLVVAIAATVFGITLAATGPSLAGNGGGQHHQQAHTVKASLAGTGTYLYSEWVNTSEGQTQANVEGPATCDCTGTVTRTWTGTGGNPRKEVTYPTNGNTAVIISYKQVAGVWSTYDEKALGVVDGAEFNTYWFQYPINVT